MHNPLGWLFGWRRAARQACLAVAACGFLAGCTTWAKPGADEAALDRAQTHCKALSYAQLPANRYTTYSRGASYGERKKCEKYSSNGCRKYNGRWYAIRRTTHDANSQGRQAIFRDCMYQGGWSEVPMN